MGHDERITSVAVTGWFFGDVDPVTRRHTYGAGDVAQRQARSAVVGWCGAIWITGVVVEYAGGRVDVAKAPTSEAEGGGDGLEGVAV